MTDPNQQRLNIQADKRLDSVETYTFDQQPIKGYPELRWRGKRPFTQTNFYPAQLKESYGDETDGWMNRLYWGDNLQVMSHLLKEFRGKVQLVYIDPPFDSKADYKKKVSLKGRSLENEQNSFEEKQYTDIWTNDGYLQFMYERLVLIRELLSPSGSIYVHCDWHKSHYLRLILDEIFGIKNFKNDITWNRTASHNDTSGRFSRVKDNILFYSLAPKADFNTQFLPYSEEYIASEWKKLPSGRFYKYENMLDPRGSMKEWDFHGTTARWRTSPEKLELLWNAPQTEVPGSHGRIKLGKDGYPLKRCRIMFLDEMKGVPVSDNWTDVSYIAGKSKESQSYPTQKPEALIRRMLESSSNSGDIVFDCFMGSGTTQAVAMKLGRRFIGADINLGAIETTTKRLIGITNQLTNPSTGSGQANQPALFNEESDETAPTTFYTGFELYNVNHYDIFRNPLEARELLLDALEIDKLPAGHLYDGEKDGHMVKLMPVNRIATPQDLNDLITNFDYAAFEKRKAAHPRQPVEQIMLVCMGHDPALAAHLQQQAEPYQIEVQVVDILRDRNDLTFKRDSEAEITVSEDGSTLTIEKFYPMNLLKKLSLAKERVDDWREMVESVKIDWNYDGAVLSPAVIDIPAKNELVAGAYPIPETAGTIRIKITDVLSESLEQELVYGA